MQPFSKERTSYINIKSPRFKYEIPCIYFNPLKITSHTVAFIFVGGKAMTFSYVKHINNSFFDNHYLISFEGSEYGHNKNKTSRSVKSFLNEIDTIVNFVRAKFPTLKIFLLGESLGAAMSMVYYAKYMNKVNGLYCWNMAMRMVDPNKKTFGQALSLYAKVLLTILTNIPTHCYKNSNIITKVSSNQDLIKVATSLNKKLVTNSREYIAFFFANKFAWKWFFKHLNDDSIKFIYFQSEEDYFISHKMLKCILNKSHNSKHFVYLEKGYHNLAQEWQINDNLYEIIERDIKSS